MLCIFSNSIQHQSFVYTQLNDQIVPFQAIQLSISRLFTQFKCQTVLFDPLIGNIRCYPSGQSRPGINGYEEVVHIPQNSSITGASPSDHLVSYLGHLLVGGLTSLQRCSWWIISSQLTGLFYFSIFVPLSSQFCSSF